MKVRTICLVSSIVITLCGISAEAKKTPKETVTVILKESQTTPYDWYVDGRMSMSCYGNSCSGHYSAPTSGTQQIQGAILKLQRLDGSVAIAQCVSKVNVFSTIMGAVDALNYDDPNSPTVYRDCRVPLPGAVVEAGFQGNKVKIYWQDGRRSTSETYAVIGILQPANQPKSQYLPAR